jgi:hypothetical protein
VASCMAVLRSRAGPDATMDGPAKRRLDRLHPIRNTLANVSAHRMLRRIETIGGRAAIKLSWGK